jgi:predicted PurR-regulated permease PerM
MDMIPVQEPEKQPPRIEFEIAPKSIAAVVITGVALWLLCKLWPILLVILCSLILVGTVNPIVGWLESRGMKRVWAVTLVFVIGVLLVGLLGLIIFPPLIDEVSHLVRNFPAIQAKLAGTLESRRWTAPMASTVRSFAPAQATTGAAASSAFAVTLGVVEVLGYAGTSIVLAVYFLTDYERLRGFLYALTPRDYHLRLARIIANMEPIVGGYLRGQIITSLAIGVFTFALLHFSGVSNALALAAFAGLTDVIPFVGGLLATAPAVVAAMSRGPLTATVVFVAMVSYQEFESRVLVPRIYGKVLRLPSAAVIIALLVGGKLGGIMGALLALPLAAALRMLVEELRVELPGDDTDASALKKKDAKAELDYAREIAGASGREAGTVATRIADEVKKDDA